MIYSLAHSSSNEHRVMKTEFVHEAMTSMVVGGTGCPGPVSNMFDHPQGIFIDQNFNLFVADTDNNRIQLFLQGQLNGITVTGFGASIYFLFYGPTDIVLDGDGCLFTVDSHNHRIVRAVPNGFECLFACSSQSGASSDQLSNPKSMAFDRNENILVVDLKNH